MIKRDDVHKAVDDGLLDAIKDRVKIGTVTIESESNQDMESQFELGLRKLRDAGIIQHAVVDKIFPE